MIAMLPRPKLWFIPSGDTVAGLPPVSGILLPSEFLDSGVETGVVETDKCCDWKWVGKYEFCSSVKDGTGGPRCNGAAETVPNALLTDAIGPIRSWKSKYTCANHSCMLDSILYNHRSFIQNDEKWVSKCL